MIHQLGKREILIIKHLINAKKPLSSDVLGVILGASPKTVRSCMTFVGDILKMAGGAKLISKTGSGYTLEIVDENEFRVFLQTFNAKYLDAYWIPSNTSSRVNYIIRRLMLIETHLKMDDLKEELYISRVTLTKDLREVRSVLKKYHLKLEHRAKYGLRIIGRESHFRVALVDYLEVDEDSNSFEDDSLYKRDPKIITDYLIKALVAHDLSISTNSLRKLVKLIIVSEYRFDKSHPMILSKQEMLNIGSKSEYEAARQLAESLGLDNWPLEEIAFISIFIISRRNIMKNESFSVYQEALFIEYSRDILAYIETALQIDFGDYADFDIELAKHLRSMVYRVTYGFEKRDVGILESKGSNPAFEYAVIASKWLSNQLGFEIQETEIAFLSYRFYMHFRFMSFHMKSKVLVVLSNGKNASDLFIHELNSNFGKFIEIAEAAEYYEIPYLDVLKYDCIITDIPAVQFDVPIDVKRVNYFFTDQDIMKMKNYFTHTQVNSKNFLHCFDAKFYFSELDLIDKNEIIKFLFNEISKCYKIDSDALEMILERESISSCERGNSVAIPHTLLSAALSPIIAIGKLKRPIIWDKEVCQLVLLVINGREEAAPFLSLSVAKSATGNIQFVYELIKSESFEQVQKIIENYVDQVDFY
jgi:lichenan operon transcriptional antiterminator